jgi:hypothetical protein
VKRVTLVLAGLAALAFAVPAGAVRVDDPTGEFSDANNAGYVEVAAEDGALLRACNENRETPGGDSLTGYIWVNPNGEDTVPTYPPGGTPGNVIGAADADGEGEDDGNPDNGTEEHDCP